jgi:low temperature requirement protein LtrA
VFVFALTQVTALMAHDLSWHGVLRGLLLTGLLWWSWIGFSGLCNLVKADEGSIRGVRLLAMAAMFVIALAIPEAFHDLPGGVSGPVVIALAYFAFRALHLVLFWLIADGDPVLRRTLLRFAPSMLGGTALLLVASQFHGSTQTLLWGLVASLLGLAVTSALWWIYFDASVHYGERALAAEPAETRPKLARDAYTFLHFPMVAGVVMLALGLKKVLEYVGDTEHHHLDDPLKGVGLYALFFGVVLYLLGHVGFKWRTIRTLGTSRLVTAALCAIAPFTLAKVAALGQLAVLTALLAGLVAFESVRFASERDALKHADHDS